ncbi:phospholipase DDHD2 [Cylas formicarius]|uniref:phospholipase DDHD2 n=1 Tax=Cylas formicarius TaxID=197179 RepID=UPI002958987A|nr:phospholipase DDHD2 [Cylas formicarius]
MSDQSKKVKNTLFSASVTGGTFEDFSQNAVLHPAMEKPALPVVTVNSETLLQGSTAPPQNTQETSAFLNPIESAVPPQVASNYFQQPPLQQSTNINFNVYGTKPADTEQETSNITSILSSFSNYLKLNSGGNQKQDFDSSVAAPAGLDSVIGQSNPDAPPVPLFPPSGLPEQPDVVKPPPTGPQNSFRRPGLKRPVYAPVPGLTSAPIFNPQQPPTQVTFLQPPTSASPASSTSSIQEATFNLPNQFKPISPTPVSFPNFPPQIPHPQHYQGPVMDAIPASEALEEQPDSVLLNYSASNDFAANTTNQAYRPVYRHWFFKKEIESKVIWQPFSMIDSLALEHAFTSNELDPDKVISTDGGRFDVNILRRQRMPVYWKGKISEVRRCSWFYKNSSDGRYVPYEENIANKLEEEFRIAFESNQWHRKVELASGETIVFHGPDVLVLFPTTQVPDAWGNTPNQPKPRVVKRGMDEFDIDDGEPAEVDHLLFMVHGIGAVCDLKFRTIEEVVDEFRSISLQLIQSHYRSSCEKGIVNRIEVLPIGWYEKLHSEETGVDKQLKSITLESIPRLRDFTNGTLLDVLFYTSPMYCQTIMSSVGDELNSMFDLFKRRNPTFKGQVSLSGHSLGSVILFDLLAHQPTESESNQTGEAANANGENKSDPDDRKITRRISYLMGTVGGAQPRISYPKLTFNPKALFALGSPIGMFITVRGLDKLGEKFSLPTCPAFYNIFHPYDPVAYRLEALINPELAKIKPVLIPHHKGRKRMHLELKETMARVGADLKQKVFESMKSTWNSFYQLAMFHRQDQPALEAEVNKTIQKRLETTTEEDDDQEPVEEHTDIPLGNLNGGRRIDFVLQEAPLEFFNEYIFALTSHVCYWDSEDTILMVLKEIYSSMNISTDDKIPQQTMTIERQPASLNLSSAAAADSASSIQVNLNLQAPPKSGFVKRT